MSRLRLLGRHRDLACRQAVALLTEYLDGALAPRARARLERHLSGCTHCAEFLAQLRLTVAAAAQIDLDTIDDATRDDLVDLYRRWRAEEH